MKPQDVVVLAKLLSYQKKGVSWMQAGLAKELEIPQLSLTDIKVRSLKARDRQYQVSMYLQSLFIDDV